MSSDMHNAAGHLTALGWTTFVLYLIAALLCFRAAVRSSNGPFSAFQVCAFPRLPETGWTWLCLGIILTALGMNKVIDLQTWLIELGRHIAGADNLREHRRALHVFFFTGFILVILALLAVVLVRLRTPIRKFARQSPLAAIGSTLVGAYIVLRAVSIDHVDQMLGFDLERIPYWWLLEAGGLLLIIIQTVCGPQLPR